MPFRTSFAEQVATALVELDLVLDPLVAFGIGGNSDGYGVFAEFQVLRPRFVGGYSASRFRCGWLRPVGGQE